MRHSVEGGADEFRISRERWSALWEYIVLTWEWQSAAESCLDAMRAGAVKP